MPSFEMVTNLNCELTSSWRDIVWLEFQTGNWQNGSVDLLPSSSLNLAYRTTRSCFGTVVEFIKNHNCCGSQDSVQPRKGASFVLVTCFITKKKICCKNSDKSECLGTLYEKKRRYLSFKRQNQNAMHSQLPKVDIYCLLAVQFLSHTAKTTKYGSQGFE